MSSARLVCLHLCVTESCNAFDVCEDRVVWMAVYAWACFDVARLDLHPLSPVVHLCHAQVVIASSQGVSAALNRITPIRPVLNDFVDLGE